MATMKNVTICNICGSNDDWRVIGTYFDGLFHKYGTSEILNVCSLSKGGIKGTADQTSSCQHLLSKRLVQDI